MSLRSLLSQVCVIQKSVGSTTQMVGWEKNLSDYVETTSVGDIDYQTCEHTVGVRQLVFFAFTNVNFTNPLRSDQQIGNNRLYSNKPNTQHSQKITLIT